MVRNELHEYCDLDLHQLCVEQGGSLQVRLSLRLLLLLFLNHGSELLLLILIHITRAYITIQLITIYSTLALGASRGSAVRVLQDEQTPSACTPTDSGGP
jgi:hypothetical protein